MGDLKASFVLILKESACKNYFYFRLLVHCIPGFKSKVKNILFFTVIYTKVAFAENFIKKKEKNCSIFAIYIYKF